MSSTKQALRISVVTPNFNTAKYLEETIQSVLTCLSPQDEYFVVDGGSTDDSVEIIQKYESRLTAWISEPDQGYADAVNKGLKLATGDILLWINASDLLLDGCLDRIRQIFLDNRIDLIFGDDLYIDEQSHVIRLNRGCIDNIKDAMLFAGWTPLQDACSWRRSLYETVGGINPDLTFAADYDLFLRMSLAGQAQYFPIVFSAFRRHDRQKSIAGGLAYKQERQILQRRQLAALGYSIPQRLLSFLKYQIRIRWRVYILVRRWRRRDIEAEPVFNFKCGCYWPPSVSIDKLRK